MLSDKSTDQNDVFLLTQQLMFIMSLLDEPMQPLDKSTSLKGYDFIDSHLLKDTKLTIKTPSPSLLLPTSSSPSSPTSTLIVLDSCHSNMAFNVSSEELKSFHSVDRDLFTRLVIQLRCDVNQAMYVMALWLWLEEIGYPSIIMTLRVCPEDVVGYVFEEAVTMLNCIRSDKPPSSSCDEIPRTYRFYQQEITLDFLHENRDFALNGIKNMVTEVCNKAFDDIHQQASQIGRSQTIRGNHRNAGYVGKPVAKKERIATPGQLNMPVFPFIQHGLHPGFHPLFHFQGFGPMAFHEEANAPMIPNMPMQFPNIRQQSGEVRRRFEFGESSHQGNLNPRAQSWFPAGVAPPEDRTMFMTFSRGYPITEEELRNYFTRSYGDVVKEVHMEQSSANVQPLYAIVVFRSPATVNQVLNGRPRVKFVIKGKHVWTRRFVPKH
ncbi:hypothetical protein AQUCO_02600011v1 [Aquilegia coerulea]|uniref:RRM domain-containing protein n=1 Tax=Aquilegia coerulea TaxID=218851 RepID=A0A2G5D6X6_AQUCA|nr:hypothetical protein AQUCO_02600011v1 [Aquilegia coerulea]